MTHDAIPPTHTLVALQALAHLVDHEDESYLRVTQARLTAYLAQAGWRASPYVRRGITVEVTWTARKRPVIVEVRHAELPSLSAARRIIAAIAYGEGRAPLRVLADVLQDRA